MEKSEGNVCKCCGKSISVLDNFCSKECYEKFDKKYNKVNHPDHYNKGIECIDYIESWDMNFNIGNAIKYITRCDYKGKRKEDLQKAMFYIQREIDKEDKHE